MDADIQGSRSTAAAQKARLLKLAQRWRTSVVDALVAGRLDDMLAALLGVLAFLIVLGPAPLDWSNIAWLKEGDPAAPYLAWMFYRDEPWQWPPALNATYGIEQAGSILYSDANALMAMLFKPLSPILPETFQYFGLWLMAVFILQATLGRALLALATPNRAVQLIGTVLLLFAPPFIARFGDPYMTHVNLTAHWLCIGPLVLCLSPEVRRPILWWTLLLIAGVFVSPYFAPMVAPLWAADWFRRKVILQGVGFRTLSRFDVRSLIEPVAVLGISALVVIGSGVGMTPKSEAGAVEFLAGDGFGWYLLNVLSPIDSRGWSYFVPDIPNWGWGDYEGFAYLGLGGLILIAAGLIAAPPVVMRNLKIARIWPITPLLAVLLGLTIFALSNNIAIGPWQFYVPWPGPLETLGAIFRSTGRFFWPMYYFLFAAAVWFLTQRGFSGKPFVALLAVAAVAQIVDTRPGWAGFRERYSLHSTTWPTELQSPFWNEAAARYARIRRAPPNVTYPFDRDVTMLAGLHDKPTDLVFLSRGSLSAEAAQQARVDAMIESGEWEPDSLFILNQELAERAAATLDPSRDLLALIDGRYVLAPGWRACADCFQPSGGSVAVPGN